MTMQMVIPIKFVDGMMSGVSPVDGINLSFASIRTGIYLNNGNGGGSHIYASIVSGKWYSMNRTFFSFDTSPLSGTSIVSAFIELRSSYFDDSFVDYTDLVNFSGAESDLGTIAAWGGTGSSLLSNNEIPYSKNNTTDKTLGTVNSGSFDNTTMGVDHFDLNANGLLNINLLGDSIFALRGKFDRTGSEPSWISGGLSSRDYTLDIVTPSTGLLVVNYNYAPPTLLSTKSGQNKNTLSWTL